MGSFTLECARHPTAVRSDKGGKERRRAEGQVAIICVNSWTDAWLDTVWQPHCGACRHDVPMRSVVLVIRCYLVGSGVNKRKNRTCLDLIWASKVFVKSGTSNEKRWTIQDSSESCSQHADILPCVDIAVCSLLAVVLFVPTRTNTQWSKTR